MEQGHEEAMVGVSDDWLGLGETQLPVQRLHAHDLFSIPLLLLTMIFFITLYFQNLSYLPMTCLIGY